MSEPLSEVTPLPQSETPVIPKIKERRKRRSSEEIMQRLLSAAEQEFNLMGYRGATTAAIARRAEVTEAQLFRYFDSKIDLFSTAVIKPLSARLTEYSASLEQGAQGNAGTDGIERDNISRLQTFIAANALQFKAVLVEGAYRADKPITEVGEAADSGFCLQSELDQLLGYCERDRPEKSLNTRLTFALILATEVFRDFLFPAGICDKRALDNGIAELISNGVGHGEKPLA